MIKKWDKKKAKQLGVTSSRDIRRKGRSRDKRKKRKGTNVRPMNQDQRREVQKRGGKKGRGSWVSPKITNKTREGTVPDEKPRLRWKTPSRNVASAGKKEVMRDQKTTFGFQRQNLTKIGGTPSNAGVKP